MDQAPYRSMPTSGTAALIRENRILREMLRVTVAVFAVLAIAASLPASREETGVRVDVSEPASTAPAPPMTVSAMRQAVEDAALAVRIRPDDADRVARHQLLIAQLYDLETTGRLAAKR